jgi:Sec-independent protein translocase protein TatA
VTFGLTHGEIILVAFIFALVYGAGLLPKLAARLSGASRSSGGAGGAPKGAKSSDE